MQKDAPPPLAEAPKATARLMITAPTPGAEVSVDAAPATEAPFIGEISPGNHVIAVTAKGHDRERREIQVFAVGVLALDLPQKERRALLGIDAPAGAEVTVDGRVVGVPPLAAPLPLGHGRHFVGVMRNGSAAWTRDVDVERGETTRVTVSLESSGHRKVALGFLDAGVVGLAGSATLALLALEREGGAREILEARAPTSRARSATPTRTRATTAIATGRGPSPRSARGSASQARCSTRSTGPPRPRAPPQDRS